jgi:pyruvate dehydrogenase kinase 2/3/4
MAQRAYDLLTLPHGLNETPAILQVAQVYLLYLEQFQKCPVPNTVEAEEQFTKTLQHMILERSSIPNAIAKGIDVWAADNKQRSHHHHDTIENGVTTNVTSNNNLTEKEQQQRLEEMEYALYRFFTARVGLRFLTQHHIMSNPKRIQDVASLLKDHKEENNKDDDDDFFLGCIQTNCEPVHEVNKVVKYVQKQTKDHYGICPEIQIVDTASSPPYKDNVKYQGNFTYVPHHLRYMVGELLKNSCRATIKRYA